ncbi:YodC family protein [Agrobacterium tumefaciens]
MDFNIGDVVQLKSGRPLMTVSYKGEKGNLTCYWFNQIEHSYEPKFAEFKPEMLKAK